MAPPTRPKRTSSAGGPLARPKTHKLWLKALLRRIYPRTLPPRFDECVKQEELHVLELNVRDSNLEGWLENAYGAACFAKGELVDILVEYLRYNRALFAVLLKRNRMSDKAWACVAQALEPTKLVDLDLQANSIGRAGCKALGKLLQTDGCVLESLMLAENCVDDVGTIELASALQENVSLQVLDLGSNRVTDDAVKALAVALSGHCALRALRLGYNSLVGTAGAVALAEALRSSRMLQELDLSGTAIGDGGAAALAPSIRRNSVLLELRLRDCGIGPEGGNSLASALHFLVDGDDDDEEDQEEEEYEASQPGGREPEAIAERFARRAAALQCVSLLRVLDLSCNDLGADGAVALLNALQSNARLPLRQLSLAYNAGLGLRVGAALKTLLLVNKTLLGLDLQGTHLGEDSLEQLEIGWSLHTPLVAEELADLDCACPAPRFQEPGAARTLRAGRQRVLSTRPTNCSVWTAGEDCRAATKRPASNVPTWALEAFVGEGGLKCQAQQRNSVLLGGGGEGSAVYAAADNLERPCIEGSVPSRRVDIDSRDTSREVSDAEDDLSDVDNDAFALPA